MTVAIHQPNFLPWLGYFDKIKKADHFVFLDDVAFVKGHICNRNKIKTQEGEARWLTVPVNHKKGLSVNFNELELSSDPKWRPKIINILRGNYSKAPFFKDYIDDFEKIIKQKAHRTLADLNIELIKHFCYLLEIDTDFSRSSIIEEDLGAKNERNINIVRHAGGDVYLSGQGAKKYNDPEAYEKAGIKLEYQEFEHPEYPQVGEEFVPNLCVLDLIFNCGPESKNYL